MKSIKFENELRPKLRKAVGIFKISYFPMVIHNCKFLKDFENTQNQKLRYF